MRTYRLETFPTERAALAAGGQITHRGRCGACSSFQDLAVYIEQKDLNRAGRLCGLRGTLGSKGTNELLQRSSASRKRVRKSGASTSTTRAPSAWEAAWPLFPRSTSDPTGV